MLHIFLWMFLNSNQEPWLVSKAVEIFLAFSFPLSAWVLYTKWSPWNIFDMRSHKRFFIKSSCSTQRKKVRKNPLITTICAEILIGTIWNFFPFFGARKELGKKNMQAYFILRNHVECRRKTIEPFNIPSRYERFRRRVTTLFWSANLSKVQYKSYRIISSSNKPYVVL